MPKLLAIESGNPVLREFNIPPMTREEEIFLKHQQVLAEQQDEVRKEVPLADGKTLNMVFND